MNGVKRIAFGLVLFSGLTCLMFGQGQSHHCTEEPVTTKTRWGGNETVLIDLRDKPVRIVTGTVEGPGVGHLNTLVQVFRRKPSDAPFQPSHQENELPVAACVTRDDGVFTFSLPAGEYELRMSQNVGVNVTSVLVAVKPGSPSSKKIRVVMSVGT